MKSFLLFGIFLLAYSCYPQHINAQSLPNCNNWLKLPSQPSFVTIGDLDITGDKLTIECLANRTSFFSGGVSTDGDLVSKHTQPSDANYILRPTGGLIETQVGFFATPPVCAIQLNKTYHYAMVYDGSHLKFYRNGFLMREVAATGDLVQNDVLTSIGLLSVNNLTENFVGYINEVRIWNVARTQQQIRTYMSGSLPNPSSQAGLLAYYTFEDLLNKQGNDSWNGSLLGDASFNEINPNCSLLPDSCNVVLPVILTNFTAKPVDNKYIKLQWSTEAEFSIKDYTIERSPSGNKNDFISLGKVLPKSNSISNNYVFEDNSLTPNKFYYYRILINDNDGSIHSSDFISAELYDKNSSLLVYPNPATTNVNLVLNTTSTQAKITLTNAWGNIVFFKTEQQIRNPLNLDLRKFPRGTYWLTVQTDLNQSVRKITLL